MYYIKLMKNTDKIYDISSDDDEFINNKFDSISDPSITKMNGDEYLIDEAESLKYN